MRIQTLGPLEVIGDAGQRVALPAAKERTLLWLLLIAPGRVVTTDLLVDALWDGQPPPTAITTLRSYVSRLRKVFGDARRIEARPTGYVLHIDAAALDASRASAAYEHGRSIGVGAAVRFGDQTADAARLTA